MITIPFDSVETRPFDVRSDDLGFSRWETGVLYERSDEYDVYSARPRGRVLPFAFLLKALKPRHCGSTRGAAIIERDRFLGSLACPRLLPVVDFVRPRRVSATQARRGCVVVPYFAGKTLAQRLAEGERFSPKTLYSLKTQLEAALVAVRKRGWSLGELTPDRVLLGEPATPGDAPLATIVDFSLARRFEERTLLADVLESERFDPDYELAPDVFFDPNASPENDEKSLRFLLRTLEGSAKTSTLRLFADSNETRRVA